MLEHMLAQKSNKLITSLLSLFVAARWRHRARQQSVASGMAQRLLVAKQQLGLRQRRCYGASKQGADEDHRRFMS
jgi:hypothetical protein